MKRTYKQDNVLEAAKKRVAYMFDEFQNKVQVNISGGKDSTVIADLSIKEALKGELRVGSRYAYWVEVARAKNGKAFTGQMTVFLKSDLDKLEEELRNR